MQTKDSFRPRYVAGFLFSPGCYYVVLVQKRRPTWQSGLLNAVGGKIEPGETGIEAMRREFKEETGVNVQDWAHFATLSGEGFEVEFYRAESLRYVEVESQTDEPVRVYPVSDITSDDWDLYDTIPNILWLIPMAFPHDSHSWPYKIQEKSE